MTAEGKLYPTEQHLIASYMDEPLTDKIDRQHEQLKGAWQHYIVREWLNEAPSSDKEKFAVQVEEGEYLFTVARAKAVAQETRPVFEKPIHAREPLGFLALYVLWNGCFAYLATKPLRVHRKISQETCNIAH